MQVSRWHARPPLPNARCRFSCSACFFSNGCNSHSRLRKPHARGVVILWICLDATEPHAFGQAVSRSGPPPSNEWWHASYREAGAQVRYNAYLRDMPAWTSVAWRSSPKIFRVSGVHNSLWTSPWSARSAVQANHNRMPRKWTVLRWSEHGMSRKRPTQSWPHPSGADKWSSPSRRGGR